MAHMIRNTDKEYFCVHCGSDQTTIVRESPDPRLKCLRCNGLFDASQSTAAKEANALPDGINPAAEDPSIPDATSFKRDSASVQGAGVSSGSTTSKSRVVEASGRVPRTPNYVLVSKDRTRTEFTTSKDIKRVVLRWQYEDVKFDVFELQAKQVSAKVDIS